MVTPYMGFINLWLHVYATSDTDVTRILALISLRAIPYLGFINLWYNIVYTAFKTVRGASLTI